MNYKDARHGALSADPPMAEDSRHDQDDSRRLAIGSDCHIAVSAAVEEIFLEGDSAVMLRHEAGSARTISLLESANVLEPRTAQGK